VAYQPAPWDFESPDNLVESVVTDAPSATLTHPAQGAGPNNGKVILNYCVASVLGCLAILWLFGGVLMKDARL
jgi:hypothetical protein